jgi:predicted N-formylglutamate amidohydrolase
MKCIISCEHASNRVPPRFEHLFQGKENVLASHQAYDPGAAGLARRLAKNLKSSVYLGSISRLLIDLNRSPSNRKSLFSSYTRKLGQPDRELLLRKYYHPYRATVETAMAGIITAGQPVLHLSIHSFSPIKNGRVRRADIGLLYDPARPYEKEVCAFLARFLQEKAGSLRVRKNYPYLGKTDGLTAFLRRKYAAELYVGLEIELNQANLLAADYNKNRTEDLLAEGIGTVVKLQDLYQIAYLVQERRTGE